MVIALLADLRDPRLERTKARDLMTIPVIAICASIADANDCAEFGRSRQVWFATVLDLSNGTPAHDMFWRVFRALDPDQFHYCHCHSYAASEQSFNGRRSAFFRQNTHVTMARFLFHTPSPPPPAARTPRTR